MSLRWSAVDLDGAAPAEAVVVIDVLRAFTTVAWAFELGIGRVLAVDDPVHALHLAREVLPGSIAAGEQGGRPLDGFDLGNSPDALRGVDLTGRTLVHRTSAGTQGLARTVGSGLVLAASFVTAAATARTLRESGAREVVFVVTGASHGRDGDEDLACAELIAARAQGEDPDPAPFLARVAASDAGRNFVPDGPAWFSPVDLALACEVDRFDRVLTARPVRELGAVEVRSVAVGSVTTEPFPAQA
jgi:2-phosphosulfolactate phosphatase